MTLSKRQVQIAEMVREAEFLSVDSLASRFDVTTQTIRRDLNRLCDHGFARRRHGGVEAPDNGGNLAYRSRRILNSAGKRAIASAVAREVPDNASVAFSIGTTPELVMEALLNHQRLKILTNNLNVAMIACSNQTFEVVIPGGQIRCSDRDILGSSLEAFFTAYNVDIGIFGCGGVDADGTLLDFYDEEVRARQLIRANCRRSFLVLDHSKFCRHAHVRGGRIDEADHVFCDRPPPEPVMRSLNGAGRLLTVCGEGTA